MLEFLLKHPPELAKIVNQLYQVGGVETESFTKILQIF
jgi:hypothetical protein